MTTEVTGPPNLDEEHEHQHVNQEEQTLNESSLAEDTNTLPNDESGAVGDDGGGDLNASMNDASADEAGKGEDGSGAHSGGGGETSAGKKDETSGAASGAGGADAEKHKKELLAKRKTRQPKFDGNLIPEEGDESDVRSF